jgi:steroid delta-isomerase-like uncharacterized protein
MSIEENKALIRRFIEGLNRGDLSVMDECFADGFANHRVDGTVLNRDGYKQFTAAIVKGAPDLRATLDEMLADGERVAFRFTMIWTDKNGFMGQPPTGKSISMSEAYFVGFDGGKMAEFLNFQARPRRG